MVLNSMQRDPVVSKASELLRLGLMPSPAELRAGKASCGVFYETITTDWGIGVLEPPRGRRCHRRRQAEGRVEIHGRRTFEPWTLECTLIRGRYPRTEIEEMYSHV